MKSVLLVGINSKYIHSNLAIHSIRAYSKEYAHVINIAEYTINQQLDEILQDIFVKKPDIIGFSCYIWNIEYVLSLVVEIKKIIPDTIIYLGGPEVSYRAYELINKYQQIKGIIIGEGEDIFYRIIKHHNGDYDISKIENIFYRDNEKVIYNEQLPKFLDMDELGFTYDINDNKIIYYESSRGCPFSCSYCLSSIDKRLRFKSIEVVKKELKIFLDNKVRQVKFIDRTFNCKKEHSIAIWQYILDNDNGITNFHFEISADLLSKEEIELLSKLRKGAVQLEIGIQTTNQVTVKEIRRTMDLEKVFGNILKVKANKNVHQHVDLIAGLPYEDYESFKKSFNQVYSLKAEQLQLGFLKVLHGSYMYENKDEYNLLYKDTPPYEVLSTRWLSYEEVISLKGIEEMVEIYYNSAQFANAIEYLERYFDSPFDMFFEISNHNKKTSLIGQKHSRIDRYNMLLEFALKKDFNGIISFDVELFKELLTYDVYLRENIKTRPEFAKDNSTYKRQTNTFYQKEEEQRLYLPHYKDYNGRQLSKMTHIEVFCYDVLEFEKNKDNKGYKVDKKTTVALFDYKSKNDINSNCIVSEVKEFD